MWILDNVAWRDTSHDVKGKTIEVPRGSVCASLRAIATDCGVGVQVVRTATDRFTTENMINTQATHGKTIISVCNYEKHQFPEKTDNTTPNTRLTQEQHNANTQKKQGNNITSNNTSSNDDGFDEFWQHVPRKVAKGDARKAFKAALKKAPLDQIMNGMECYAASVKGKDPQYIAHPATWLNGERWADEAKTDTRKWYEKPEEERTKADRDAERFRWL